MAGGAGRVGAALCGSESGQAAIAASFPAAPDNGQQAAPGVAA
jgi:hypothetical protein